MLPLLPESCIFDILFRHGGFRSTGFNDARTVNQTFPKNTKWVEVLCAFLVVDRLRHPAEGLYLLIPEDPDNANSSRAWCVARHCQLSRCAIMQALRFLIPSSPFHVNEWLDRPEIPDDYERFAHEYAANDRFTAEWGGDTIVASAATELRMLDSVLYDRERQRMVDVRRPRFRLSFADEQAVNFQAEHQVHTHRRILQETDQILDSLPADLLDRRFQHVTGLVSALVGEYPALAWNLKLGLHRVAIDKLGFSVWYIERQLMRGEADARCCPLHALRHLAQ